MTRIKRPPSYLSESIEYSKNGVRVPIFFPVRVQVSSLLLANKDLMHQVKAFKINKDLIKQIE